MGKRRVYFYETYVIDAITGEALRAEDDRFPSPCRTSVRHRLRCCTASLYSFTCSCNAVGIRAVG